MPAKILYNIVGTVSLALGIIGIFLPILPTTPFILLSAYCYYRGSKRFHDWLINHPQLGPIVEEYGDGDGMTKQSKRKALIMTWTAVTLTVIFLLDTLATRALVIGLALVGTYVILRLKTRES